MLKEKNKTHSSLISKGINRVNETKIDIEEKETHTEKEKEEDDRTWRSMCLSTNKHAVIYFGQLTFSLSLVALCSVMLIKANGDCSQSGNYINILSFLAGKMLSTVVH
tara:strand:- start:194 stop:517 length:324 start_codon:yes stop_codon:yes gene_type:complete